MQDFIDYAKIDPQNRFGPAIKARAEAPSLYRFCNPEDVEIQVGDMCVRFVASEDLDEVNASYSYLGPVFVFATSDGDPIYLKDGAVYCAPHGYKNPKETRLADSFEEWTAKIIEGE